MGKKSGKGKEKKLKRKEEIQKLNQAVLMVKTANELPDPLAQLPAFQKFSRNDLDLRVECKQAAHLSEEQFDETFALLENNMKSMYEASSWGWNEKEKKQEMREDNARYLLVYDPTTTTATSSESLVAMCHFRFDVDDDVEVLYCYEVQLHHSVRRKGLGKFLMQILELMGVKSKMKKVVLTVFKHNTNAVHFFTQKMKYTVDDTSPQYMDEDTENYDYEIYSKLLPTPK